MKRTINIDFICEDYQPRTSIHDTFKATVKGSETKFPTFTGRDDHEVIGKACIYLNNIKDVDGNPEYIAEIDYSDAIVGKFKK